MDGYTIGALAIGALAFIIGVSRLIFRTVHVAKHGTDEAMSAKQRAVLR